MAKIRYLLQLLIKTKAKIHNYAVTYIHVHTYIRTYVCLCSKIITYFNVTFLNTHCNQFSAFVAIVCHKW